MPSPGLTWTTPVFSPRGIVLMLHGGAKTGRKPVGSRSASFRRTSTMRDVLEPRILGNGLSLWLLRFSVRGWNADASKDPSPVVDARWAIDQAASAHPDLPVILLGHSMGARTAVHVADHDQVAGVVGLAPWLEPGDPVDTLSQKHLIVGHGSRDKITSASATRAYVDRAAGVAASAQFEDMGRLGHYMLHRPQEWNAFALRSTVEILRRTLTDDDQFGDRTAARPVG